MNSQKRRIIAKIDSRKAELLKLSRDIHANPEVGFQEFKAVEFITKLLVKEGFEPELNYCGFPTALRVVKRGKGPGPRVTFIAEYDALKGIGHGCGHNVITASAVGAFLGLAAVMGDYAGEISIIGTPAEESGGGKILLLEKGGFRKSGYVLMIHPAGKGMNLVDRGGTAATIVTVVFTGKNTHSAIPMSGVNALNATLSMFNQIDLLRGSFQRRDSISGVILEGGVASYVIPDRSVCEFCIRAVDTARVNRLVALVRDCVKRSEGLTGARAEVNQTPVYAEKYANLPICDTFKDNMSYLGIAMNYPDKSKYYGASDIGNVSIEIPSMHAYLSITEDETIENHTPENAEAAISEMANQISILGAKGLAMTGLDILESAGLRHAIRDFHEKQIPKVYR